MMRKYKRYEAYQDSGVEWIGEIPESWKLIRFKYLFSYQKGNSPNEYVDKVSGVPYLSMNYLRGNNDEITYVRNDSNMIKVENNQILLLWDGSNSGEFIKSKKGLLSSTMSVITDIKLDEDFSFYYFKASEKYLKDQTIGMGIPHVDSKILKNLYLSVPEKAEQQNIASFLDQKTAEIDEIINKKEKLINHLEKYKKSVITEAVTKGKLGNKYINEDGELVDKIEMKDSGFQWIGHVPQYFKISKLKHFCNIIDGDRGKEYPNENDLVDKGILFLSTSNITNNKFNFDKARFITRKKFSKLQRGKVRKNDIIITVRGTIGATALFNSSKYNKAFINAQMMILRTKKIKSKLLYYITLSDTWKNQLDILSYGSAQQQLSNKLLSNVNIFIPGSSEIQNILVDYLNNKKQEINCLIQKTKKSIEKYKEYKKSLIFEAVTGKIDLRDYELEGGEELAEHNNSSTTERKCISAVN